MHQRNFIHLLNQLEKTGFDSRLESALTLAMQAATPGFELISQYRYGKHSNRIDVCLYFRRSDEDGHYAFHRFHAMLTDELDRPLREQTFYVDRPNTITAKEAINLNSISKSKTPIMFLRYGVIVKLGITPLFFIGNSINHSGSII